MPHEYVWRKTKHFIKYRILHVDDTPHQVALGAAFGIFVAWTPTIGVQTLLAIALATLFRANKAITVPIIWVSNPATAIPMFWFNWKVGSWLMGGSAGEKFFPVVQLGKSSGAGHGILSGLDPEYWVALSERLMSLGGKLWVGSLLLGVIAAILGYVVVHVGVTQYRLRYCPWLLPRVRAAGEKLANVARTHPLKRKGIGPA